MACLNMLRQRPDIALYYMVDAAVAANAEPCSTVHLVRKLDRPLGPPLNEANSRTLRP